MNAILFAHPSSVSRSGIDQRLIYHTPVDLKIDVSGQVSWTSLERWRYLQLHKRLKQNPAERWLITWILDTGIKEFTAFQSMPGQYRILIDRYTTSRGVIIRQTCQEWSYSENFSNQDKHWRYETSTWHINGGSLSWIRLIGTILPGKTGWPCNRLWKCSIFTGTLWSRSSPKSINFFPALVCRKPYTLKRFAKRERPVILSCGHPSF